MKRILMMSFVIIGAMSGQVSFASWHASCELRTFKATAYYSPQEGQRFYVKGSLEEDKILNGNGTHGASGRAVFNGMIAAPKIYAFGTRIYVPGRGIGQIEDRGGAIVSAGERNESFDRLDFWAGAGQEGLDAALRFGVRYFDAYVCPKGVGGESLGFSFSRIPLASKQPATLRETDLGPGVMSTRNPILQRYLKRLGYMTDVPESIHYGAQTKAAVCSFQQAEMGISPTSAWCGWFGAQTRVALQSSLKSFSENKQTAHPQNGFVADGPGHHAAQEAVRAVASSKDTSAAQDSLAARLFAKGGEFDGYILGPLQPGDSSKEVRILQRKLQRLGHYPKEAAITGIYDTQTIRAVYAFQLAQGLLVAEVDPSVYGYLGPKTRAKINSV